MAAPAPSAPPYSDAVVQAEYAPPMPSSGKGWITLILVIVVTIVILGILWLCWHASAIFGGVGPTTTTTGAPPACSSETSQLPPASSQCCVPQTPGASAQTRYLSEQQLFIDPAAPPSYQTVCRQFCAPGSDYNTSNDTCSLYVNGNSDSFNACIQLLKPDNCTGAANPVAIGTDGVTLFYAQSHSTVGCVSLQNCPS